MCVRGEGREVKAKVEGPLKQTLKGRKMGVGVQGREGGREEGREGEKREGRRKEHHL
jgi:hypothetical protein